MGILLKADLKVAKADYKAIESAFNALMNAQRGGLLPDLRKVLHEGTWLHVEVSMSVGDYRGFFVSKDGNKTFEKVA